MKKVYKICDCPMYFGSLDTNEVTTPEGSLLPLRLDLRNHSPTGFSWGYMGSGPSQLALALLTDVARDEIALEFYFEFKQEVISQLPLDGSWHLEKTDIMLWLYQKRYDKKKKEQADER